MPAIASIDDLKAAQKDVISIYAMVYLSFVVPEVRRRRMRFAVVRRCPCQRLHLLKI
jgi:hypothetical protein